MRAVGAALLLVLLALGLAPGMAAAADPPRIVSIRTIPAVKGLTLRFQDKSYVTDADGRVQIPRERGGSVAAMLPLIRVDQAQIDARTKVRFARWFSIGHTSIASLDVFRRVGLQFVDTQGAPVAPARVERVVLRSTSGAVQVLRTRLATPRWLYARRVSLIHGHTVLKNIRYAIQRVNVLGADVVNAGQQTFSPEERRTVKVELKFFTLTVRGEDALFGSARGSRARLVLPNGEERALTMIHGEAVVRALPRGAYKVTVEDGLYRTPQPLVLSRTQVAVVPVVTYLDLISVGGGLLLLALGLVLAGRPYLARRAGRIALRRAKPEPRVEEL